MLPVKEIAKILGASESAIRAAIRTLNIAGAVGDRRERYFRSAEIDQIAAHLRKGK